MQSKTGRKFKIKLIKAVQKQNFNTQKVENHC